MDNYIMYLRKSRSDNDYASESSEDTLQRHEAQLTELAKRKGISMEQVEIYREVVSADTISNRPEMQKLLRRIEKGDIAGVFVMEVERLARGDTLDQGTVARAFKLTNTLIITPVKTYDPNNLYDAEYFEFGLFMSRREYQAIKRRLCRGRVQSVLEGKYIASHRPYGYTKKKLKGEKGYTLEIEPEEAKVVKAVFDMWTEDGLGTTNIAKELNNRGIISYTGNHFTPAIIRNILTRRVYCGELTWGRRSTKTSIENGEVTESRPVSKDFIISEGLHEPIVSKEQYEKAQRILKERAKETCPKELQIKNPFAGIIKCAKCGKNMQRRPFKDKYLPSILCPTLNCKNMSSLIVHVEEAVLRRLEEELESYKEYISGNRNIIQRKKETREDKQKNIESRIENLKKRYSRICEGYEAGAYDINTFKERSTVVKKEIEEAENELNQVEDSSDEKDYKEFQERIPLFEAAIKVMKTGTPEEKNKVLKKIIDTIIYNKEPTKRRTLEYQKSFTLKINYKRLT